MKRVPAFKSTGFGLIDIGVGRTKLEKYFSYKRPATVKEGIGFRPINKPIKVTIEAEIVDQWGINDETSIEFELEIKSLKVKAKQ